MKEKVEQLLQTTLKRRRRAPAGRRGGINHGALRPLTCLQGKVSNVLLEKPSTAHSECMTHTHTHTPEGIGLHKQSVLGLPAAHKRAALQ